MSEADTAIASDPNKIQRLPLWYLEPENIVDPGYYGVFEGGGAKGIAYIGALRAMEKQRIWFSSVAGASSGAITAALIAAGANIDQIQEQTSKILNAVKVDGWFEGIRNLSHQGGYFPKTPLYDILRKFFAEQIKEIKKYSHGSTVVSEPSETLHDPTFAELHHFTQIELNIVATDLSTQQLILFNHIHTKSCSVAKAVLASLSIPFAFEESLLHVWDDDEEQEKVKSEGENFKHSRLGYHHTVVDGGVWSNFPWFVYNDECFRQHYQLRPYQIQDASWRILGFVLDEAQEYWAPLSEKNTRLSSEEATACLDTGPAKISQGSQEKQTIVRLTDTRRFIDRPGNKEGLRPKEHQKNHISYQTELSDPYKKAERLPWLVRQVLDMRIWVLSSFFRLKPDADKNISVPKSTTFSLFIKVVRIIGLGGMKVWRGILKVLSWLGQTLRDWEVRDNGPSDPSRWPRHSLEPNWQHITYIFDGAISSFRQNWYSFLAVGMILYGSLSVGFDLVKQLSPPPDLFQASILNFLEEGLKYLFVSAIILSLIIILAFSLIAICLAVLTSRILGLSLRRIGFGLVTTYVAGTGVVDWLRCDPRIAFLPVGGIGMLDFEKVKSQKVQKKVIRNAQIKSEEIFKNLETIRDAKKQSTLKISVEQNPPAVQLSETPLTPAETKPPNT